MKKGVMATINMRNKQMELTLKISCPIISKKCYKENTLKGYVIVLLIDC